MKTTSALKMPESRLIPNLILRVKENPGKQSGAGWSLSVRTGKGSNSGGSKKYPLVERARPRTERRLRETGPGGSRDTRERSRSYGFELAVRRTSPGGEVLLCA